MKPEPASPADSPARPGGAIPGAPGEPAFTLHGTQPSAVPVLIAVPHAGRAYPPDVVDRLRDPAAAGLRLEDRHVDTLAAEVARQSGAVLLVAHAPRAMIDLNRATDDVDWGMFPASARGAALPPPAGGRAPGGLGLIPRRVPGLGELWKRRHERHELDERIALVHQPYHARLGEALWHLRDRWGAALLLDFHSMPPLAPVPGQARGAEFVLGDRFGASCHGRIVASAFEWFARCGRLAAHNRPYAGGHVLERHAATRAGIHALQIEIDRSSYLDSRLDLPAPGLAPLAAMLAGLVRQLAREVVALGNDRLGGDAVQEWPQAAE